MIRSFVVCASIVASLCLCGGRAAGQATATWRQTTPMVVNPAEAEDILLEVGIDGSPTSVRLFLASTGTETALADNGSGGDKKAGDHIYTIRVHAADAVDGLTPDSVNRNFVGFIRLYVGATRVAQYNLFFDVLTDDIPPVDIRRLSDDVQYTPHLVNIVYPDFFSEFQVASVIKRFYTQFDDNYDFINVIYGVAYFANRYHFAIRNDVQGTGQSIFDYTAVYGSGGRLLGCTVFPIPGFFDGASPDYQHELGHQWINYLPVPPLDYATPHWPLSDLASGIMGWWQGPGGQGLNFNFDLVPAGGDYLMVPTNAPKVFTDLGLYLMGLVGPDQVGEHFVFDNQEMPTAGNVLHGPVTTATIDDVIAKVGPRKPDHLSSPKAFTVATVIVSKDGLLSEDTMRLYDSFSARAMEERIVPYTSGFAGGQAKPFYLSTGGRGRLDTRIDASEESCTLTGDVDAEDLQILACHWLASCGSPDWCEGADYNHSGIVNFRDFCCLARHWRPAAGCGYWQQAPYAGDCGTRPAGTFCATFSDGYIWLLPEALSSWESGVDCRGRPAEIAYGATGRDYCHVLGTDLVKIVTGAN
jgi:hypothetical protein